ncbi:hypothetical protein EG327_007731 [Venturia inaequalis]|uniref:Uncharacterized protein n=1 Tax=Venturia inaequalis TaxID=5025 RepID=A0A8H3VM42_VENIN|nr:hypothetical protein EG327_007731 [Venturia inaequalis]
MVESGSSSATPRRKRNYAPKYDGSSVMNSNPAAPGYDIPPERPDQRIFLLPKAALTPLAGDSRTADVSIFADDLDVGYVLDLFNHRTGPRIQGFFDRTFWNRLVVQIGHNEPAILSAMRAVCAVYEQVEITGGELAAMDQSAIAAYNKAIQLVVKESASSKARMYIPLIVCALFVCLEFLQGNQAEATTHIEGGISMLSEWRGKAIPRSKSSAPRKRSIVPSSSSASSDSQVLSSSISSTSSELDLIETLTAVFSRLRLQSGVFGRSSLLRQITVKEIPKDGFNFQNMSEARDANVELMNKSIDFIMTTSPAKYTNAATSEMAAQQNWLKGRFHDWRRAIEDFLHRPNTILDNMERKGAQILMCLNNCCLIWTSTCLSPEESQYDKYKPQFEEMVDQCASIANLSPMYFCNHIGHFQFDMGLVAPLHMIGSRCRWRHIRKTCLKVLGSHHWREGLFDSYRSYRYIKAVMDLEEAEKIRLLSLAPTESDAHLPPEGARIHFAELGPSDPHSGFQVHTFFTKRFGPRGDWYMQTKSISTSSKDPATDPEEEPQSAYIASMLQKGLEVVPNDSSTKAFADRSNGMFYYHLVGPQMYPPKKNSHQTAGLAHNWADRF